MVKYAVLDIEATGGKKGEEKIIDIAIYQFDGEKVLDQFGSIVNPEKKIDPYVQKLTGITDKQVRGAPKFHELAKRIVEITEGCTIVGHGVDFDYRMLRQEFRSLGYDYQRKTLDTLSLSKDLIPEAESHSLGKLCKSLGIPVKHRHSAQGDTLATLDLFKLLLEKDTQKKVIQSYAHQDPKNKEQVKKLLEIEQNLPEKAGVFYFHNAQGNVFYLNADANIASKVNKEFTSEKKEKRRLQSYVHHVSFELTGNLLVALLKAGNESKRKKNLIIPFSDDFPYPYGIFISDDAHFQVLKIKSTTKRPLLLLPDKAKGFKEIRRIKKRFQWTESDTLKERKQKINQWKKTLQFPDQNLLLLGKGRNDNEKSFILIKDGKAKGYGFYQYHNQLENQEIRDKIMLPLTSHALFKPLLVTALYFNQVQQWLYFEDATLTKIQKNDRKRPKNTR